MPVPGPRTQHGPNPGYRNPGMEEPDKFNQWKRPGPIFWPGRSPGMMAITLRGNILGFGQIRRLYRQTVNFSGAQGPFSWTDNANDNMPDNGVGGYGITRSLRYMTKSVYVGGGVDNTRYAALHSVIKKRNAYKTVTVAAGSVRGRPTVRNRLTSFGSRVPTLNQAVEAAEKQ